MSIIIHLQGGLGNQLFQYATAKAISESYQVNLLLDDSWFYQTFTDITARPFLLHNLQVFETRVTHRNLSSSNKYLNKINLLLPRLNEVVINCPKPFKFEDKLFCREINPAKNYYLIGYLQSFRYFENIRNSLLVSFQPKLPLSPHYTSYLENIQQSNSIMLHIRRSDYVSLKTASTYHGALSLSYYLNCMGQMIQRHPASHFFIFSDDAEWAKSHLPKTYRLTFIEIENRATSVVDELYLMSQCHHHIIANSSLSWWGAWLSEANEKQTILTPNRWLSKKNIDLSDLLPATWERNSD